MICKIRHIGHLDNPEVEIVYVVLLDNYEMISNSNGIILVKASIKIVFDNPMRTEHEVL